MANKKKLILDYIQTNLKGIDPTGKNVARYTKMFKAMSDKQFDKYMKNMRDKKLQFYLENPNMEKKASFDDIKRTAKKVGCKLFHKIWQVDPATGKRYLSNQPYPVLALPMRRMQQYLDKKRSVPHDDKKTDALTGQVTGEDRTATLTMPEIQALNSKGLSATLHELVAIRGGNSAVYGEMRQSLEEQGSVSLNELSDAPSRTAVVTQILLEGMMLSNNLVLTADSGE